MADVRLNTESILVEAQKKQVAKKSGEKKASGIDFKNDTMLVTARAKLASTQKVENNRLLSYTTASLEQSHTDSEVSTILSTYQNLLNEQRQAQAQSASLSTRNQSALEKLAKQNEVVAGLEEERATSQGVISQLSSQISTLNTQKTNTRNAYDSRISSTRTSKQSAIASISSSYDSQIASKESSITDDMTEEEKSAIQSEISSLRSQKASAIAAKEKEYDDQIAALETAKADALRPIENSLNEKSSALATERANLNAIEARLGQEIFVQIGFSLEQASIASLLKEAQTYENSVNAMLKTTSEELAAKEITQEEATKKTEEAKAEYEKAKNETATEETAYNALEAEIKAQYEKEENDKNIFLA